MKVVDKVELIDQERSFLKQSLIQGTLEVDFELDYENKIIGKQKNEVNFLKINYQKSQNQERFV